jgi:hypothetical protein
VEPTICIANSSHAVVLNNHLQEENICLLNLHAWSFIANANNRANANPTLFRISTKYATPRKPKYARVKYCRGNSDEQGQSVMQYWIDLIFLVR